MVETPGQKLRKAREQKNWTVEEVARATRIRPERVTDLENDEYGNFPNLSYGRNFLLLYARHLGLHHNEVTESYANENMFGLDDYEYLRSERDQPMPAVITDKPRRPYVPLIIGFAVIILILTIIIGFVVISAKRISSSRQGNTDVEALEEQLETVEAAPAPVAAVPFAQEATPAPAPAATPVAGPPSEPGPGASPASPKPPEDDVPVLRAVPVNASETPPAVENVVVVQALQNTKVTVRQGGSPDAPIVFDNVLARDAAPLTLRGDHFYIEVEGGGSAVKIMRNGQAIPYTEAALIIE